MTSRQYKLLLAATLARKTDVTTTIRDVNGYLKAFETAEWQNDWPGLTDGDGASGGGSELPAKPSAG